MISILNEITMKDSKRRISFVHGSHDSTVRAFHSHVKSNASCHPDLTHVRISFFLSLLQTSAMQVRTVVLLSQGQLLSRRQILISCGRLLS